MPDSTQALGLGLHAHLVDLEQRTADGEAAADRAGAPSAAVSPPSKSALLRHASQPGSPARRRDGTASMVSSFLSPLRSRAASRLGGDADADFEYADSAADAADAADRSISMLSTADPAEIDELEEGVRQSRTIEDFTKIITEFRLNRKSTYAESLGVNTETGSQWGGRSDAGSDAGSISNSRRRHSISGESDYGGASRGRCTCCCSRDDCPSAIRARQEWRDLEADLRLSAEIGQALLKRHDAMYARSQKQAQEYIQQRDGLMSRLTRSYKETSVLERQLAQANLNLEAADSSNRNLLHELDEVRGQLAKLKASHNKLIGADERAGHAASQLDDAKQELNVERKRADAAEAKLKKLVAKNARLSDSLKQAQKEVEIASLRRDAKVSVSEEALEAARQRLALGLRHLRSSDSGATSRDDEVAGAVESLVKDNEALRQDNAQLRELLDARNEELAAIRDQDACSFQETAAAASSPRLSTLSRPPSSLGFGSSYRMPSSSSPSIDGESHNYGRHRGNSVGGFEPRPVTLSEEVVVAPPNASTGTASSHPPVTVTRTSSLSRRAHPVRSMSRSSAASSSNAAALDALQDSPRSIATGLLSPTATATTQQSETPYRVFARADANEAGTGAGVGAAAGAAAASTAEVGAAAQVSGGSNHEYDGYLAETAKRERDNRTGQLSTLLEYIQRLFARLSSADVDTLTRRLQRQHLAGDVGHLARTTVNSILRDVDGLRDHFRRSIEQESRQNARDDSSMGSRDLSSESLVSRKEFFALLKAFRDILCEVARLRMCINEIHMNPGNAAKLLQEHLGVTAPEDKSLLPIPSAVGWLGKMLLGGPSSGSTGGAGGAAVGGSTAASATGVGGLGGTGGAGDASITSKLGKGSQPSRSASSAAAGGGGGGRTSATRAVSNGSAYASHLAPRASAAVVSSSVAVEVKGLRASAAESIVPSGASTASSTLSASPPPSSGGLKAGPRPSRGRAPGSLSRVQSRNLSGLFAGTLGHPDGFGTTTSSSSSSSSRGAGASHSNSRRDPPGLGGTNWFGGGRLGSGGGGALGLGASPASQRPLSRIVDDDEVSLHHGRSRHVGSALDTDDDASYAGPGPLLERTLRPRGLSDSSIRSTFIDHGTGGGGSGGVGGGVGPSPVSRIITPATLALQCSSDGTSATMEPISSAVPPDREEAKGRPPLRQTPSIAALSMAAAAATRSERKEDGMMGSGFLSRGAGARGGAF
ncbi:hypothetical protein ACQY0O_004649 [Thecaphora frezii]